MAENILEITPETDSGLTAEQITTLSEAVPGFDVNHFNEQVGLKAEKLLDVINDHASFSAPAILGAGLILLAEGMHMKGSGAEMPPLFNTLGGKAIAITAANMLYRVAQISEGAALGKRQVNRAALKQAKQDLAQFFESEGVDHMVLDQI